MCLILMSTDCYSSLQNTECQDTDKTLIFYNKSCMAFQEVCSSLGFNNGNTTHCWSGSEIKLISELYTRVLSSEEYFRYGIHCHQRCIVSGGSVTSLTAVQRWGARQKLLRIASAKRVIVDRVQRLRSRSARSHMGELRRHTMGTIGMPHASLDSVLLMPSTRYPDYRQSCLLHRALPLRHSYNSASTR